jgi:hypothetical protein
LPQLSLRTIVDHEDTSGSVVTRIINRGNGASQKFNHEYWMRMHRLLFDLTHTVSIFSGLHVRRIIPAPYLQALQNGRARASGAENCNVVFFRGSPEKFHFNTSPNFAPCRGNTRHLILRMHHRRGRACSHGKSRRPHNYAACEGFRIIK